MHKSLLNSFASAVFLAFLLTMSPYATQAQAETCACDFVINPPADPATSLFVDGVKLGVKPGQTICLNAGFYRQIRFQKLNGEPGNPITIRNCGGLVDIGNDVNYGTWYAVDIISSKYLRLTGTGDPGYKYGIRVSKSGDTGLKIGALSTDTEIDHIEIGNTEFAGIMAKTDFGGSPPPDAPEMNNVNIHDNYIHDTMGEGMYIGETKTPGQEFRHLQVWNNVVTRTGLDLIQIANSIEDVQVNNNVFYKGGTRNTLYHNKGLQIGDNTVGRYFNNFIIETPSNSMIVLGSGNIDIFNNYLATTVDPGFFIDNRTVTTAGAPIRIYQNYMMEVTEPKVFFNAYNELNLIEITQNHLEGNNEILGLGSGAGANVSASDNVRETVQRVQFTDAANDDFTLTLASPHQNKGLLNNTEVDNLNKRPFIALIPDQTLEEGMVTEVAVSALDPDNDAMVLEGFNLPPFVSFQDNGGGNGKFILAPQGSDIGVYYKVRVRVTDADGAMNTQYFSINVLQSYSFLVTASSTDGENYPENTLDLDVSTRWAATAGAGEWIKYDLREDKMITDVKIAFYNGASAKYTFAVEISEDDKTWLQVFAGENSGMTTDHETFAFEKARARFLRIVDQTEGVNSYNEVAISCTTASELHLFYPTDDVYTDGPAIYNGTVLKAYESKRRSYMRYSVSGLDVAVAPVVSARMRLKALENQSAMLETFPGTHNNWSEKSVRKSDLPGAGQLLNSLSENFTAGQVYEVDVLSAVVDNGVYTFILGTKNTKAGITFSSRQGEFQPELVLETLRGAKTANNSTARSSTTRITESPELECVLEEAAGSIELYPNPASERLAVDLGSKESGPGTMEICDSFGKSVYRKRWTDPTAAIDLDLNALFMPPGVYLVKIKQDAGVLTVLRLVKN